MLKVTVGAEGDAGGGPADLSQVEPKRSRYQPDVSTPHLVQEQHKRWLRCPAEPESGLDRYRQIG
jgi:hypothetical protein